MKVLLLLLLSTITSAQDHHKLAWDFSVGLVIGSQATDIASNWHGPESNPVLGRGRFGYKQASIKVGLVSTMLLAEWLIARKKPVWYELFTPYNYTLTGVTAGVTIDNFKHNP